MSGPFERPNRIQGKDYGPKKPKQQDKDGLRVNREIRAAQIRVIDDEGKMIGVMTVTEGIRLAEEKNLDLLEIAPSATPPTCRIMDYGKWKYENKKKAHAARKKQVVVHIKEIQLRPRTDEHDLETKLKHSRRFLLEGDKVKVNLRFMGREMVHQDLGMSLLRKVQEALLEIGIIEVPSKFEGKQMFILIAPDPVKIKAYLKANPSMLVSKPEAEEEDDDDTADEDSSEESAAAALEEKKI